ncbi:unnamed protein product, partial [Iphiclides podalirius]
MIVFKGQDVTNISSPQPPANTTDPLPYQTENQIESETNAEILDILGVDPSVTLEYGADINKDVATRLTHIATMGLNKDMRKELVNKHLIPANSTNIAAPLLNPEIKAALSEQVLKRDKAIETRQKQIAAGITHLGKIISDQLNSKEMNNNLIKDLMDVSRIFCDIQHSESEARRNFALYSVKKDLKDQLSTTKIDKYLFGEDLGSQTAAGPTATSPVVCDDVERTANTSRELIASLCTATEANPPSLDQINATKEILSTATTTAPRLASSESGSKDQNVTASAVDV